MGQSEEFSTERWRYRWRRGDFGGQERKNDTHASTTDPDARLYRKPNGAESRLAYLGHLLIENRHGLIADATATIADGYAEREAATLMVSAQWERASGHRRTVGATKVKLRGLPKVDWLFAFSSAAFNLIRLPKLLPKAA